ncbi:hypothetical protein PIB30_003118 [Stylosanthes scabra]|uniref:Uncharacterized protein n=1 Tax=Stylosanthes scabra TaxID=79078 RepID=A0ABU6Y1M3_9FABA|nr:hypothetical protein [Stylosanthes scabra]
MTRSMATRFSGSREECEMRRAELLHQSVFDRAANAQLTSGGGMGKVIHTKRRDFPSLKPAKPFSSPTVLSFSCKFFGKEGGWTPRIKDWMMLRHPATQLSNGTPYKSLVRTSHCKSQSMSILISFRVTQAHIETMSEVGSEMKSCVRIVDACLEAFVKKKTPSATEAVEENLQDIVVASVGKKPMTDSQNNILVVDLSAGPASENTGTIGGTAVTPPKFPPGPISDWLEDCIIMGQCTKQVTVLTPLPIPQTRRHRLFPLPLGGSTRFGSMASLEVLTLFLG